MLYFRREAKRTVVCNIDSIRWKKYITFDFCLVALKEKIIITLCISNEGKLYLRHLSSSVKKIYNYNFLDYESRQIIHLMRHFINLEEFFRLSVQSG